MGSSALSERKARAQQKRRAGAKAEKARRLEETVVESATLDPAKPRDVIGLELQVMRREIGWTRSRVSEAVGFKEGWLRHIENGVNMCPKELYSWLFRVRNALRRVPPPKLKF